MPQDELDLGEPEFLGWSLLKVLKQERNDQISRSKFLKLCCIADRRLIDAHGYDVGLPRYWYMYGELANEHEFSGKFYNAPQAIGWEGQKYIPKELRVDEFDVSEKGLALIPPAVRWTVRQFGRENVEAIKQHQYEHHAANEFIQQYSELRWLLNTIDLGRQERLNKYWDGGESNDEYLKRQLDGMLAAYPDQEGRYDDIKRLYLRWDDTVRLMVDQSVEYGRIAEFLDDFIRMLSKTVLRFAYKQHISADRLAEWEADAADERQAFTTTLRDTREELLQDRSRGAELDRVSEAYSQTIEEQIQQLLAKE